MIKLTNRLRACADFVNDGARLCDVGCDHGYVPVALVQEGRIKSAVACDINTAPLASCISLVNMSCLQDKIKCVLSDGLKNINGDEIDDILLAGMGGELIVDILSQCEYVKEKHLILNPMTHAEITRKWLYSNNFDILNDVVVSDDRHHYCVFDATYSENVSPKTEIDYFLGNITDFSDKEYFIHMLNYLKNKQRGGADYSELIKKIEEKL